MKGYAQRNRGETYDGVSQPSNHEAGHERFMALFLISRQYHYVINIQHRTSGLVYAPSWSLLQHIPILLTFLFLPTYFPFLSSLVYSVFYVR